MFLRSKQWSAAIGEAGQVTERQPMAENLSTNRKGGADSRRQDGCKVQVYRLITATGVMARNNAHYGRRNCDELLIALRVGLGTMFSLPNMHST
ncbi:hypothetical protein KPH14_000791 [Odynerus spinipes]|uniref:Uncharacterized protein n=1 Tax=Odynerus spinipes TaxID=1348599 RepID=A0AAD9RHU1_9HYME|nr:hypothetical protein KPH14_000791 [Odynerus spinipes]